MTIDTDYRGDIENLIIHPGWRALATWAQKEWAAQIQTHTENAANSENDVLALNRLRQVLAAKKAVDLVLEWPERELKRLTQPPAALTHSRTGY
jgi:hypothetical protein